MCYVINFINRLMFNSILIELKFPSVPLDPTNSIHQEYVNDPLVKESNLLEHKIYTPQFEKKRLLYLHVLDNLYEERTPS